MFLHEILKMGTINFCWVVNGDKSFVSVVQSRFYIMNFLQINNEICKLSVGICYKEEARIS